MCYFFNFVILIKKNQLSKKFLNESIELDYLMIAITSTLKDYSLCHKINKSLDLELSRTEFDHEIFIPLKKKNSYFSKYKQIFEDLDREFVLLSNKGNEGMLIPENKWVDYFFIILGFIDGDDLHELMTTLKRIDDIQNVILINPNELKSKENLAI